MGVTSAGAAPLVTVIDDETAVLESMSELLEALGFAVDTYSSAASFLASASLERARCLLLDVAMPGMTGPELMRELEARGRQIPVVLITAHDEALASLLTTGASDCLIKPFGHERLAGAVRKALGS